MSFKRAGYRLLTQTLEAKLSGWSWVENKMNSEYIFKPTSGLKNMSGKQKWTKNTYFKPISG